MRGLASLYNPIYTPEQAEAIKNGSIESRNKFYIDNYNTLNKLAKNYYFQTYKRNEINGSLEVSDFLQQLYLDLPYLNWSNPALLVHTIKQTSFYWLRFGGYSYLREGNPKVIQNSCYRPNVSVSSIYTPDDDGDDTVYVLDKFSFTHSVEEEYLQKNCSLTVKELLDICKPYLTITQLEILRYYLNGNNFYQSYTLVGCSHSACDRLQANLKKHSEEILKALRNAS